MSQRIEIPVRHYRLWTHPDIDCIEENFHYAERTFALPTDQTALVMVDVWDIHYIRSHEEISGQITRERIVPLAAACREAGITVVHAPSPPIAAKFPQWVRYAGDAEFGIRSGGKQTPDWPPPDFRQRKGKYAQYAPQHEPRRDEWSEKYGNKRRVVPELEPQPGDFVIATGEQLHRLCRHRKILHLLYVGFAANICVLYRDYGTRAMGERGYNIILLRDCTHAIEAHHTFADKGLTKASVLAIEMLVGASSTSETVIAACRALG
ncbi:MAG: isochorismatase family protein [Candidatus Poribacteria bacterium]|nr:isochorismatase family protein [Candidatus Poribacteria bacterium]